MEKDQTAFESPRVLLHNHAGISRPARSPAVQTARETAANLRHSHVSTGHLLAGALEQPGGSAHELLDQLRVDGLAVLDEIRRRLTH